MTQAGEEARSPTRDNKQPHRHIHPFDRAAQHHESVAVITGQRGIGQPGEHRGATLDKRQELVWAKAFGRALAFGQRVVGGVEALPDLGGGDFACAAGVFPRGRDRVDDRTAARGVAAEGDDVGQRPHVQQVGGRFDAEHLQQHPRCLIGVDTGVFEQLMHRHVEDAGGVIGALDIAADPVQRFGVACQHHCLLFARALIGRPSLLLLLLLALLHAARRPDVLRLLLLLLLGRPVGALLRLGSFRRFGQ